MVNVRAAAASFFGHGQDEPNVVVGDLVALLIEHDDPAVADGHAPSALGQDALVLVG